MNNKSGNSVIITRQHCSNTLYDKLGDCALAKALKEQHSDLGVKEVFDTYFVDKNRNIYEFDTSAETGYNRENFNQLLTRQRDKIVLQF